MTDGVWRHTGALAGASADRYLNPPHAAALRFRLGTAAGFYHELWQRLRTAPVLDRDATDPTPFSRVTGQPNPDWTAALLMAWSGVGDVLSFYQERIINEGYLRTARDPLSLEFLLSALGAQRGAVASATARATPASPTRALDPGCAATVDVLLTVGETRGQPRRVLLPGGSVVRMVSASGTASTHLETDHSIMLRRAWNAMSVFIPPAARSDAMAAAAAGVLLQGIATGLTVGDRVLVTGVVSDGALVFLWRSVVSVQALPAAGATEVTWEPGVPDPAGLGVLQAPRLFRFKQRVNLFGADAALLSTLSRRRRLDQGVDAGGVARLPALSAAEWEPRNEKLPASRFTCVLALPDGGVCLGTEDGAYLWRPGTPSWPAARSGMSQRGVTALARGPGNMLLAGAAGGAVFRSEDPELGWDSLAGGFVLDTSGKRPMPVSVALPAEVVRKLQYVARFPGGAAVVALTDSGMFAQQAPATWLRVDARAAVQGGGADAKPPRFADMLFGEDGQSVTVCTDGAIERLTVVGAVPARAPGGKPASARGVSGFLAAVGRLRRKARAVIAPAGPSRYPEALRLRTLGNRHPMALAPLTDRLGGGDVLVATTVGAVVSDGHGALWGASGGLPTDKDGAPVGIADLAWAMNDGRMLILATVVTGADGSGAIMRFNNDTLSWLKLRDTVPAEGPVLLSMAEGGVAVTAQTPTPATEWPGFALTDTAAAPDQDGVSLDLNAPSLVMASGGMVALHDPVAGRMVAGWTEEASSATAEGFGLKRRVTRARIAGLSLRDLATQGRRDSVAYVESVELTPLSVDGAGTPPVGLDERLTLAGIVTDLTEAAADATDLVVTQQVRPVRQMPTGRRPPTASGPPPPTASAPEPKGRRIAISGRGIRFLPAVLGGVHAVSLDVLRADPGTARPARALPFRSVTALTQLGAVLVAAGTDMLLYRSSDGVTWQVDPTPVPCAALHTLLADGGMLWAAGPDGIASLRGGTWTVAGRAPGGCKIASIAIGAGNTLWAGTDSGLFSTSDGGRTWRHHAGGALDPDTAVTALATLPGGALLIGTDGSGVLVLEHADTTAGRFAGPIGRGRVTCLSVGPDRVLAGTPDSGSFASDVKQPGWRGGGPGPDLGVTAVASAGSFDLVACGAAGLFYREAADARWRSLPLGLAGALSCLLVPRGAGMPCIVVGADVALPLGPGQDAGVMRLAPVTMLPAETRGLLASGVLGPAARQTLVKAGQKLAKDAMPRALPGGHGWFLVTSGEGPVAPLYLLPSSDGVAAVQPDHPPLRAAAAQLDGGVLMLDATAEAGDRLTLTAYLDELLLLPAADADPLLTRVRCVLDSRVADDGSRTEVTLDTPLHLALDASSLSCTANVVSASQGRTVADEALGDGNSNLANQSFRLREPPLTFLPGEEPGSRRTTLTVAVNGMSWTEVGSFAGAGRADHVYVVTVDAAGGATIAFGDGEQGARLPTGAANVRAAYRSGMGRMPNAAPLDEQPMGATSLALLMVGSGGLSKDAKVVSRTPAVLPADLASIRLTMPLRVAPLGRLVTPSDHVRLVGTLPGVCKARVDSVVLPAARPTFVVSVAPIPDAGARWLDMVRAAVSNAQAAGTRPVELRACEAVPIRLAVRLWTAAEADVPGLQTAARAALLGRLGYAANALAADIAADDIAGLLQTLVGVAGAEVVHLHLKTEAEARHGRLHARPARFDEGAIHPAQLLHVVDDPDCLEVTVAQLSSLTSTLGFA